MNMSKKGTMNNLFILILIVVIGLVLFNQWQISSISYAMENAHGMGGTSTKTATKDLGNKDLSGVDLSSIKGTGYAIAALFPVENIETTQDVVEVIIPTGTPDYGAELGISYNDPVNGLSTLVATYGTTQLSGADQERYVSLVTKPVGISCEFCCGLGAVGADSEGRPVCGCKHNPALMGLTKWLIKNTDYTDAEIVREALKWKALFYPKNMIELTASLAGGDTSSLENLPGMVGGC